jgi:hypothetical protein
VAAVRALGTASVRSPAPLAEIQRVVASELKRLAVQFNDQAESLIAIHERQAKLNCPQ